MAKSSFFSGTGVSTTNTNAIENSVESAAASATAASTSATSAAASATSASANIAANQASAAASEAAKVTAVAAKVTAVAAQTAAATSANNASTSATASEASKVTAVAAQTSATASSTSAATSATTATTKAAAASISQAAAATSAANAQSYASSSLPLSGGNLTGNLGLPVNGKLILGSSTSNSLQVYNDGANSIITESSSGSLLLRGTNLSLQDVSNNNYVQAVSGGAVTIYDNTGGSPSPKIATTSSGASISGNIAVTGTVDGRDVATDGTKLDGIATNANNYVLPSGYATETYVGTQITALVDSSPAALNTLNELAAALGDDANFSTTVTNSIATKLPLSGGTLSAQLDINDDVKIQFGGGDLQIYHQTSGGHSSIIKENGNGNLNIMGSNLSLTDSNGEFFLNGTENGVVQLYCDGGEKIRTIATGAIVYGQLKVSTDILSDTINEYTANSGVTIEGVTLKDDDLILGASNKAIFNTDFEIYRDASNAIISETGAGSLILRGTNLSLQSDDNDQYIQCVENGAVTLYHQSGGNSSPKAATSATGIDITGNLVVSGTVDGRDVATDGTKLDGIVSGATADQTGAQIKTAYQAETNAFTDAQFTKLGGIEASATADQTAAEIRALVESATDSNVFTDADHTKLNGIEASADVTDAINVEAAGALMDSELTSIASVKALNQGVATGDSPDFAALNVNGTASMDGLVVNAGTNKVVLANNFATTGNTDSPKLAFYSFGDVATYPVSGPSIKKVNTGSYGAGDLVIYQHGPTDFTNEVEALRIASDGAATFSSTISSGAITATVAGANPKLKAAYNASNYIGISHEKINVQGGGVGLIIQGNGVDRATFASGGGLTLANGSLTIPDYVIHSGNTSTKFGFGSANTMNFISNGSDRLTIANSYAVFNEAGTDYDFRVESNTNTHALFVEGSSGNVSIGADLTVANISVADDIRHSGDSDTYMSFENNSLGFYAGGANPLSLSNGSATFTPSSGETVVINRDGAGPYFGTSSNHTLRLITNNTERMRIDGSSGRVGIGTSVAPHQKLTVTGVSAAVDGVLSNGILALTTGSGVIQDTRLLFGIVDDNYAWLQAADYGVAYRNIVMNPNGGSVLVGTTAVNGVNGTTISSNGNITLNTSTTNGGEYITFRINGTQVGSITTSGGNATSYNTSSDYRLKEDWQPMSGATDRLKELKPVNFAWKTDGSRVDGFLAHEAQAVVPESVTGTKDAMKDEEYEVTAAVEEVRDEDDNITTEAVEAVMGTRSVPDMQGIDQAKLVPLLVAALQEAIARIETLEAGV